ncbi:MAG: hypothetical protein H6720_28910 [Sandaracinus sp.]|nr:hypothetical protein [Sandaracinus sp.]
MTASPAWQSVVRRVARELAPVHVRVPHGEIQATFLSGVLDEGDRAWLRLRPWKRGPVGACLVEAPAERWRLRCTETRATADELLVCLRSARFETLAPTPPIDLEGLVLVCPTGVDDLHVLPVAALDASGCSVESSTALSIGHAFPHVELHGDKGSLRTASAVVVDAEPWRDPAGHPFFRHRLRFDLPNSGSGPLPDYDVLADPERIDHVLALACLLQLELSTDDGARRTLSECMADALVSAGETWNRVGSVEVAFELFAIRYEATVRVLGAYRVTRPLLLRRRRRRSEARVDTRGRNLVLRFRHPLRPGLRHAAVVDLSMRGLCFAASDEPLLWPGLSLEDAEVEHAEGRVRVGSLEVRSVAEELAHVRATSHDAVTASSFGDLLASLRHPDLSAHDGAAFDAQLDLYRACGLVMPFMDEMLSARRTEAETAWRDAHVKAPSLCRTFARSEGDEAVASVSALQAWDRTWLGQHLAARPDRSGCTPGELLMAFLDYVLLRPDCRQMVFFAAASNARMNGIQRRFQEFTGTAEAATCVPLRCWVLDPSCARTPETARAPKRGDLRVLARAARRDWGSLAARAFSFEEDTLALHDLGRAYRRVGLRRSREILVSGDENLLRWATVTERGSPGLSIPGLLHATWLLPLHRGGDDRHHVARLVGALRLEPGEPLRLVLADRATPEEPLELAGLRPLVDVNAYVLNRAGLRRYASYLLESYGERGARLSERRAS